MNESEVAVTIVALVILSGVGLMVAAMMNRRRFREMEHQERLAMIERGLVPSPESDPAGFEAKTRAGSADHDAGIRYRTAGVLMMGFGLGLLVLLTFTAGEFGVGVGVGGGLGHPRGGFAVQLLPHVQTRAGPYAVAAMDATREPAAARPSCRQLALNVTRLSCGIPQGCHLRSPLPTTYSAGVAHDTTADCAAPLFLDPFLVCASGTRLAL